MAQRWVGRSVPLPTNTFGGLGFCEKSFEACLYSGVPVAKSATMAVRSAYSRTTSAQAEALLELLRINGTPKPA